MHNTTIQNAQPGATLRDDQVKGLQLRAFEGRKSFYLYFRTKLGVERKPKLGDYPTITLAKAREIAREMLSSVAEGKDPVLDREKLKQAPTMADLWSQFKKEKARKKSLAEDERLWKLYLQPKMATQRVIDVEYDHCRKLHAGMSDKPFQANRVMSLLSTMFGIAEKHKMRPDGSNPTRHVERYPEPRRKRYASADELAKLAAILAREEKTYPASVAFIYLMVLTGARKSEVAKARWSDVRDNKITLKVHKTDGTGEARTIYLAPEAQTVLDALPKNTKTVTGMESPRKFWERVRVEAGCADLQLRDLRRSFASVALRSDVSLSKIGGLLGHTSTQTTKIYARLMEDVGHEAAARTASAVAGMMSPTPAG
jgi:integrase